jgi:hypothetical protein
MYIFLVLWGLVIKCFGDNITPVWIPAEKYVQTGQNVLTTSPTLLNKIVSIVNVTFANPFKSIPKFGISINHL